MFEDYRKKSKKNWNRFCFGHYFNILSKFKIILYLKYKVTNIGIIGIGYLTLTSDDKIKISHSILYFELAIGFACLLPLLPNICTRLFYRYYITFIYHL